MPWYHHIAAFLHHNRPQMPATRRTNLALLAAAILNRRARALSELARPGMPALPQSHRQGKKRHFRFLSNPRFDPIQTQCALMPAICQLAGIKGQTPIMIDWSDLSRKRNGLFAAVCYRKRGLPLLSWATTHDELNSSQNRLEEAFIARLLRWLQEMPRHTGRTVDYVAPLKGNVHIQTADGYQGLLRKYPLPSGRYVFLPGAQYRSDGAATVNQALYRGRGHREPWHLATSLSDAKVAARHYRQRMQPEQYFRDGKQILRRSRERRLPRRGWGVCWWGCCWRGDVRRGGSGDGRVRGESWDCCGWAWSTIWLRRNPAQMVRLAQHLKVGTPEINRPPTDHRPSASAARPPLATSQPPASRPPARSAGEITRLPYYQKFLKRYNLVGVPMSTDFDLHPNYGSAARRICRCAPEPRHLVTDHDHNIILVPQWRAALTDAYPHLQIPHLLPL